MQFWAKSLTWRIALSLFVFSLMIVTLVSAVAYYRARASLTEAVFDRLNLASTLKENELRRWVADQQRAAKFIAGLDTIKQLTFQLVHAEPAASEYQNAHTELTELLNTLVEDLPDLREALILSEVGGKILVSTDPSHEGDYRVTDTYFVQGRKSTFTQPVYPSPVTLQPTLTIATPIYDKDGSPLAVLVVHLNLERMDAIVAEESDLNLSGETYLIDQFNVFVSAQRFGRENYPRGVHSPGIDAAIDRQHGVGLYANYAGLPVVGAYRWVEWVGVAVLVEMPQSGAFAPAAQLGLTLFTIGMGAAILLAGGTYFLTRRIVYPIHRMTEIVTRIAAGDLSLSAPVLTNDEVGSLAHAFNIMTSRLKASFNSLQTSEHHYRALFEDSPVSLWLEDFSAVKAEINRLRAQGVEDWNAYFLAHPETVRNWVSFIRVLDVNRATLKLLHYAEKDTLFETMMNIFDEHSYDVFHNQLVSLAEGNVVFESETSSLTSQGDRIFIAMRLNIVPGYEETWSRVLVSVTDITARKQTEDALQESEARLKEAQRMALIGNWELDLVKNNLSWSDEVYRIFGIEPAAFGASYKDFLNAIHPDDRDAVKQAYTYSLEARVPYEVVYRLLTPDGYVKYIQERCETIYDAEGRPLRSVGTTQDITKSRRAEEYIRGQLERLNALHNIDNAIKSSTDLSTTLGIFLNELIDQLKVDATSILLFNSLTSTFEHAISRGFNSAALQYIKLESGQGYTGRVIHERKTVHVPDITKAENKLTQALALAGEKFVTYIGSPLIAKGQVVGVLEIFHRSSFTEDPDWFGFLDILAGQAAIAVDSARLFENLQRSNFDLILAYDATIEGWSRAMDLRDHETEGHTQRVTALTLKLAQQMDIPDTEMIHIRRGTLLHDIGKIGVPDNILLKPGKLTTEEWEIMRRHAIYAYEMLCPIQYLRPALDIPQYHHEKWDGTGYPHQLAGMAIPLAARIFTVVDVWDAVTSDRPYRAAWSKEKAVEYIKSESGKHFDPAVVENFLSLISKE